jgi:hypothetical protein
VPRSAENPSSEERIVGSKVKCPGCGAKNDLSSRRCRLCTGVINPDAPDVSAPAPVEAPLTADLFDANDIKLQVTPARDRFGHGPTGLGARIAAAQADRAPASSVPASTTATEPGSTPSAPTTEAEPFDPDALFRDLG